MEDLKLAYPNYSDQASPLELAVDASGKGAGACLSQWQNETHRVIAYISMTFSATQQNYSKTERELTTKRWAVRNLKSYLYGTSFIKKTLTTILLSNYAEIFEPSRFLINS